jgi:hypothetical protein
MASSLRYPVLLVLCTVLTVGTFLLLTSDAHSDQQNCGSAILPRDTTELGLDTGDVAKDDFSIEEVADDCAQIVLRQRYLTALCLVGAIVTGVAASRVRRQVDRFPGDPIV